MFVLIETYLCGQEDYQTTEAVARADTREGIEEALRKAKLLCVQKIQNTGDGDEVDLEYDYEMHSKGHGDKYMWEIIDYSQIPDVADLPEVDLLEGHNVDI